MRGRGLKYIMPPNLVVQTGVAPHAGAWIEITSAYLDKLSQMVAPHAGAWIEIPN